MSTGASRDADPTDRGPGLAAPTRVGIEGDRIPHRDVGGTVVAVALALAIGVLVLAGWYPNVVVPDAGPEPLGLISRTYDPPTRSVEVVLNIGDGQIFATQAIDPVPGDGGAIRGGPEEQAYRYQRGAYGWVGWVASGGRADAVPWALAVVTALSVAALVGVVAEVIRRRGGPPLAALVLLATPGVITDLLFVGPEALGATLAVAGMARWWRRPGDWPAVALLAGAGLCRETLLLVPAALALAVLLRRRWGLVARLAVAIGLYLAWVLLLRVRLGAWPVGSSDGRLVLVPFQGALEVASGWGVDDVAGIALVFALAGLGLARSRSLEARLVIGAHLALAAVLGPAVWSEAAHVGRVLLPMAVAGLVVLAAGDRTVALDRASPDRMSVPA